MSVKIIEITITTAIISIFTRFTATLDNVAMSSVVVSPTVTTVLLIVIIAIIFSILLIVLPITAINASFIPAVTS